MVESGYCSTFSGWGRATKNICGTMSGKEQKQSIRCPNQPRLPLRDDVLSWGGVGYDFCLGVCGGDYLVTGRGGMLFGFGMGQGVIFGYFSYKEYSILQPDLPNLLLFQPFAHLIERS